MEESSLMHCNITTVSYTHLDVYKRQVQYRADDVVRLFTESFHKRYGVECSAAPVSYTHLDVYKRQI